MISFTSCTDSGETPVVPEQISENVENPEPQASQLFLLDGNNCTQQVVGETTDNTPQYINFKETDDYQNDEARSLAIANVGPGFLIRIYDDPSGSTDDDWVEI